MYRYTLQDMREYGRKKGWCPYFTARHMLAFANVMVYNYQYMLDPKASNAATLPPVANWNNFVASAAAKVLCSMSYQCLIKVLSSLLIHT